MKILFSFLMTSLLFKTIAAEPFEGSNAPWGVDSQLHAISRDRGEKKEVPLARGRKTCRSMIRFFQDKISPIDGPRSSYFPSSSQYTLEAIESYGVWQGILMGCDRLLRENGEPWIYELTEAYGGIRKVDPVR